MMQHRLLLIRDKAIEELAQLEAEVSKVKSEVTSQRTYVQKLNNKIAEIQVEADMLTTDKEEF